MSASQVIESDSSCRLITQPLCLNPRIRSVLLHIRAQYGATRILGIGRGALSLCHDLREKGYTVASTEPEESSAANPTEFKSRIRLYPPLVDSCTGPSKTAAFEMAVSIESSESFSKPSALVKLAAAKLQNGGIFVLSVPYGGCLKKLLITAREWWNLPRSVAWDGGPRRRWSKKYLTALLKSEGFTILEFIGVRNRCSQWEALILVAKKTD